MQLPDFVVPSTSGVVIDAFVQPRAGRNAVAGVHGAAIKFKIAAPALEDRANRALEAFVAQLVGVSRSQVSIVAGRTSRHKRIEVVGVAPEVVADALEAPGRRE
jgi:uncharacterized protein